MYDVYVSVGSNIDPRQHIPEALLHLREREDLELSAISPVYRTRPIAMEPGARPFHNLCLHLRTCLAPEALKRLLRREESRHGRTRADREEGPFRSRVLDLDILLYVPRPEGFEPHPQTARESFVVYPLSDLLDPSGEAGLPASREAWRTACSGGDILGRVEYEWPPGLRECAVPGGSNLSRNENET